MRKSKLFKSLITPVEETLMHGDLLVCTTEEELACVISYIIKTEELDFPYPNGGLCAVV